MFPKSWHDSQGACVDDLADFDHFKNPYGYQGRLTALSLLLARNDDET